MIATRRGLAVVAGLLLFALLLRLGVILVTPGFEPRNDAADYARHAESIAAGDGYPATALPDANGPTALRPPAYPYFLGAVYAFSGDSAEAGRIAQALLGTLVVALVGVVAFVLWGPLAAAVAVAVAAVYPPLVVGAATLASEPLFLTFMLGAVASALALRQTGAARWAVATGLLAGLAVLARSNGAVLLLPLAAAAWGAPRRSWRPAAMSAVVLAVAALMIAPWTVRNALAVDAFVPVAAQDGFTLAGTYNDTSRNDARFPAAWRPPNLDPALARVIERHAREGEVAVNRELRAEARRYVAEHPAYLGDVALQNGLRLFYLGGRDYNRLAIDAEFGLGPRWTDLIVYGFVPFALLAIAGCFTRAARSTPAWLCAVPLLMLASAVLLNANPRFRLPADPFIAMLAGLALSAMIVHLKWSPAQTSASSSPLGTPRRR